MYKNEKIKVRSGFFYEIVRGISDKERFWFKRYFKSLYVKYILIKLKKK